MCIIVNTAAQGRQNRMGVGVGLQEGEAIAALDFGRIRNKTFSINRPSISACTLQIFRPSAVFGGYVFCCYKASAS